MRRQSQSLDRTLTVQDKAPIRAQTVGARRHSGNVGSRSTGQRQGSFANPSTGQIGPTFDGDCGLSIPAISLATHAGDHAERAEGVAEVIAGVLTAAVGVKRRAGWG